MNLPHIINIQKYSLHDGDGIRTTVFFKGCHLTCIWCHNPESQSFTKEFMFSKEKCKSCLSCIKRCPSKAIATTHGKPCTNTKLCTQCETCIDFCPYNAREFIGEQKNIDELFKEIEKDRIFYDQSYGGVTLSGGEVMAQNIEFILPLVQKLKNRGYNIAIDTCGFAPLNNYLKILPYIDTFLYDIKLIDNQKHLKYMGKSNELILDNLKKISDEGANINIRIPVIGGVNEDIKSMLDIIDFLKENIKTFKINLLPYHNLGTSKYDKLNLKYQGDFLTTPTPDYMEILKKLFINNGFSNTIIGG
ncbi:trans-4-hydroxy-L-proline dehydratase activase [uncultured Cetobacterium sp.]|uniref:trans-4-hydroxy-L-proline dehydratase activase n=1 Tax=uncultured Cetobacterium sp. TaxID=527638 RepID=UPI00261A12F6|nr:trans-4-hydroxy-L-proline dehydratase activase [uncultured Cetobacterium sp.]